MKPIAIALFMIFIIVAVIFAVVGKNQQMKNEREWKDWILSNQVTLTVDNAVEHNQFMNQLVEIREKAHGVSSDEVNDLIDGKMNALRDILLAEIRTPNPSSTSIYSATAYCVTSTDGEQIILNCRRFPT